MRGVCVRERLTDRQTEKKKDREDGELVDQGKVQILVPDPQCKLLPHSGTQFPHF